MFLVSSNEDDMPTFLLVSFNASIFLATRSSQLGRYSQSAGVAGATTGQLTNQLTDATTAAN
jgi:hypothetical protein